MVKNKVVTRFGPSPTGFLHIGAIRTALFAYLYAKANQGKFILRIEDTDKARCVEGAIEDVCEQLKWLGLNWDEGPVFQSKRLDLYQKYSDQLIQEGKAYYCFCTKERTDALRQEQQKNKQPIRYDGFCRKLSLEDAKQKVDKGEKGVVRFKTPQEGKTTFIDTVREEISFDNSTLDDLILLKSDGYPTYHLAHVVDDHLMGVTHVHRGEEWIPSSPKHILIFQAFGWKAPQYVHLPVILSQGGGKLSKRKGSVFVREFKEKGYLKEAMVNFMVLLGWGYDEKEEFFTLDQLEKIFSHKNINKASPVFSSEKLDWFNGMYIRKKSKEDLAELCHPFLVKAGLLSEKLSSNQKKYFVHVIELLQERINLLSEIVEKGKFFFVDDLDYPDPKLLIPKKTTKEETINFLESAHDELSKLSDFSISSLETSLRKLSETLKVKSGKLFMPIRIAVSGSTASPGLFEMLSVLGKEKVVRRVGNAVEVLKAMS